MRNVYDMKENITTSNHQKLTSFNTQLTECYFRLIMLFVTCFICNLLVIANILTLTRCDEMSAIVGVTMGLGYRYFAGCTVILHPYPQTRPSRSVFNLSKMLATPWGQRGCVLTRNIELVHGYLDALNKQTKCSRVLIIVYGNQEGLKAPFIKLTHNVYGMKGPLWLLFLRNSTNISKYLDGVNAPFDVDMIVGQYQEGDGTVTLSEVYRASLGHPVRVIKFGRWSEREGLISPPHVSLYYRRNNLEGVKFQVATTDTFPLTSLIRHKNGSLEIRGYFATVWKDLENRLNFTSAYFPAVDNVTGITGRNQMFFKKPGLQIRMDSIFRPFQFWIWVTILGWVIFGSIFLSMIMKIAVICKIEPGKSYHQNFKPVNSLFCVLRSFSQQGSAAVPGSLPGRILFITTYLMGVVMLAAYSGALISFIAVQIPKQPFKNLMDLLIDGSYKVIVVKDTSTYMYFANGTHPTLANVFNRLMLKQKDLPLTTNDALERICHQSKLVYFGPQAAAETIMEDLNNKEGCEIMALQQPLNTVYLSIAINKNNQYKDALNHHLDMMGYQGLLGRLRRAAWPIFHNPQQQAAVGMKVEQVFQIHVILLGGILLAILVFLIERRSAKRRLTRSRNSLFLESFNKV